MAALLIFVASAHAQSSPPDLGALRQQIDQTRNISTGPERVSSTTALPAPAPLPTAVPALRTTQNTSLTVQVQEFRFKGNQLLNEAHLAAAVAEFTGRALNFDDLQRAAEAVTATYRDAGWLARVWLPEQEVGDDGVVTFQITEARFAGVRVEGAAPKRVRPDVVEAYFWAQQSPGEAVRFDRTERALLLADDLPGVTVTGVFAPGQFEGDSELVLQLQDEPRLLGDATLDNQGARATGSARTTLNLYANSLLGLGDLLSLNWLKTEGSAYARLGATLPIGRHGLRLGLNTSDMRYRVIRGTGSAVEAQVSGRSGSLGAELNQPLVRTRSASLYLIGGVDHKTFFTKDPQVVSDYASANARIGLSGNWGDDLGAGATNNASLQLTQGRLFNVIEHPQKTDLVRPFRKLNFSAMRQQQLSPSQTLLLSLSGQASSQGLDSSEKFYIGGPASVRAYPSSELGGEHGRLVSAEWRWRLMPEWTASAFVDAGQITQKAARSSDTDLTLNLKGTGLGLTWRDESGLNARLLWSRRLGQHPKPTNAGTDGDGSLEINRLWLSLAINF